jgi:hypothetical protein
VRRNPAAAGAWGLRQTHIMFPVDKWWWDNYYIYMVHHKKGKEKVKLSLWQAVKAHRVLRCRGFHIFYTIGSRMVVRLSAIRAGRPLPPGRFLVVISIRGCVDPRDIMRLEGSGQLKNPVTSLGIEPATFRLVA